MALNSKVPIMVTSCETITKINSLKTNQPKNPLIENHKGLQKAAGYLFRTENLI